MLQAEKGTACMSARDQGKRMKIFAHEALVIGGQLIRLELGVGTDKKICNHAIPLASRSPIVTMNLTSQAGRFEGCGKKLDSHFFQLREMNLIVWQGWPAFRHHNFTNNQAGSFPEADESFHPRLTSGLGFVDGQND